MAAVDPKWVVAAALGFPALAALTKMDINSFVLIGAAIGGFLFFDNNFVHKNEMVRRNIPQVGPQPPFIPETEYVIDPQTGVPVAQPKINQPVYNQGRMR